MKLTLSSIQQQAQPQGYEVNRIRKGVYEVNGNGRLVQFRLLSEATNWLNQQQCSVIPELSLRDVQQLACEMGFLVQFVDRKYGIFYQATGQLLGLASRIDEVVRALPEYKAAIVRYYEAEALEQLSVQPVVQEEQAIALSMESEQHEQAVAQEELNEFEQEQALEVAPSIGVAANEKDFDLMVGEFARSVRSNQIEVLERHGKKFVVRNNQNGHHYVVDPTNPNPKERCQCGDCHFRAVVCKHQNAVMYHQLNATKKVARELERGDGIVFGGRIWQVIGIASQVAEVIRRGFCNILFALQLRSVEGEVKVLNPYSEAEFQVVGF